MGNKKARMGWKGEIEFMEYITTALISSLVSYYVSNKLGTKYMELALNSMERQEEELREITLSLIKEKFKY